MKYKRMIMVMMMGLLTGGVLCVETFAYTPTELRTYFNEQKKVLIKEFVPPEKGTEVALTLADGTVKSGTISSLNKQMVILQSGDEFRTIHKEKLSPESRQILFAVDFANAAATEKTLAYKMGGSATAGSGSSAGSSGEPASDSVKHLVSVTVKYEVKDGKEPRIKDSKETENSEGDSSSRSVRADTSTQTPSLQIAVANRANFTEALTLEWYFIKESISKSKRETSSENDKKKSKDKKTSSDAKKTAIACYDRGSKKITVKPGGKYPDQIMAPMLKLMTVVEVSENSSGDTTSVENEAGDVAEGYVVILKSGDTILEKKSNKPEYLEDAWIAKIQRDSVASMTPTPSIPKLR